MEKRQLGRTGLYVTALGYGAMELRNLEERASVRLLNAVLDSGITYIDTSPDYCLSETYIGKAIVHRRDEFILATKCGCHVDGRGTPQDPDHIWSRERLLANAEQSLRLLQTDHIDVWQLHGTRPGWLAGGRHDEVIQTMQELKRQGKVRAIGISFRNGGPGDAMYPAGYSLEGLREFAEWGVFDVIQVVYGGLTRQNEIALAKAAELGIGMIARGVVKRYFPNYDELFEQAGLTDLCEVGESPNSFLIRFALAHPGISTMIVGTSNPDHLVENVAAASGGKLSDEVYAEAKRRLDAVGIVADAL
ncbi:MAG: aldo/keto reductase [Anaerolineae bacterium]|nr:aldo/keto reductase [Anaerolineae bacterium]